MPSINSLTIRITKKNIRMKKRVPRSDTPGSDRNPITDMGFGGLDIKLEAYTLNLKDFNAMIEEMAIGEFNLYLRSDWYYKCILEDFEILDDSEGVGIFPFRAVMKTEEPYEYSDATTTLTKTVTTTPLTFTQDDNSEYVATDGNVDSIPNITVSAAIHGDWTRYGKDIDVYDATIYDDNGDEGWQLYQTLTFPAMIGAKYNITGFQIYMQAASSGCAHHRVTIECSSLYSGVETEISYLSKCLMDYALRSTNLDLTSTYNEQVIIRYYCEAGSDGYWGYYKESTLFIHYIRKSIADEISIYNDDDVTVLTEISNELMPQTELSIYPTGIGTFIHTMVLSDTTPNYNEYDASLASIASSKYTIGAGGFLEMQFDTRYQIAGIPTLYSKIDVSDTDAKIQIAEDVDGVAGTYYDIDRAIVDNTNTTYELISTGNLKLKGKTKFYVKIIAPTNAIDIYSYVLTANIIAIDAAFFKIFKDENNTLIVTQGSESSGYFTLELEYPSRRYLNALG